MPDSQKHTPDELAMRLEALGERVASLGRTLERDSLELRSSMSTVLEALELIHDDDPGTRRRLRGVRSEPGYDEAFTSPDPLVSVVIPTWDRTETLIERAIASALAQTHPNIEVIVIGDASPPETARAIEALDDPRVSFHNLTIRGPYHDDPTRAWTASGTPGLNTGIALARGLWIAPLGDDDAFLPQHIEQLLTEARERRLEFVYGRIRMILPNGSESLLGEFPPRLSQIGLQAAIYHAGLRFIELELGHALFGKPNDWGLVHRMMRAGVRMGMVDEVSVNYWPSLRAQPEHQSPPIDPARDSESQETRVVQLQKRAADLEQLLAEERSRSGALDARMVEQDRRLEEVRRSRSWRLTAPLRRLRGRL